MKKLLFSNFRLGSLVPTQSCCISLESSSDSGSEFVKNFEIQRLESEKSGFEVFPIDFNGEGSSLGQSLTELGGSEIFRNFEFRRFEGLPLKLQTISSIRNCMKSSR